jgi:hypothetical protein
MVESKQGVRMTPSSGPAGLFSSVVGMSNKGKRVVVLPQGGEVYQVDVVAVKVPKKQVPESPVREALIEDVSDDEESSKRQTTLDRMKKIGVAAMVAPTRVEVKAEPIQEETIPTREVQPLTKSHNLRLLWLR